MKIAETSEFNCLTELYARRDEAQKLYEDYLILNRNLKWHQFSARKWYKHCILQQREIIEGWDLLISINARRLVKLIKDEAE